MNAEIKNIIFDMGGVLLDLDRKRCVEAFTAIGFPQAEQMLSKYSQTGVFGELEKGRVEPIVFFDFIREESGRQLTDRQITDALNEFVVGLPVYKLQMLLDLRKKYNIYLLSNTSAVMMPNIRAKYFTQQGLTFDDYFDTAFLSYEMGYIKPCDEIFLKMLDDGRLKAEECLFLDDGEANIETAKRLGFHTFLVEDNQDFCYIFE